MFRKDTSSYTSNSFEEYYTRKLEAIKIQLKGTIYGAIPYIVYEECYACRVCKGRIMLHDSDGKIYCLLCGRMPLDWSNELKERVEAIMKNYPDPEKCAAEWRRSLPIPQRQPRACAPELVLFGARIEERRLALGLSQDCLAAQVRKPNGAHIAKSTIRALEMGQINCSPNVRQQLISILGLQEGSAV